MAESRFLASRYHYERRVTVISWVAVLLIAAAWLWVHHLASTGPEDAPEDAAAPMLTPSMPEWSGQSTPLINGLVIARNNIAAAAAAADLPATSAACRNATYAVAKLHTQMPSPEPALTGELQAAISNYDIGLPYCISGTQNRDGESMRRAAGYIAKADASMRAALDMLGQQPETQPGNLGVLIV